MGKYFYNNMKGLTLLEVLTALMIVAIAFTATLKLTSQNILTTSRLKERSIKHWIAMQSLNMIQIGLVKTDDRDKTYLTQAFNQKWYWRLQLCPTSVLEVRKVRILMSKTQAGIFKEELYGFILDN